jgi:hypothetical protein
MARGYLAGIGGGGALLLLFLFARGGSASAGPRFFPARPAAPAAAGLDWFAVFDGGSFGPTKAETLSAANARWRAVRDANKPNAQLWRYSFPFGKWLKVAG